MPIILYFSQRITDKAAVERALQVTTSVPVVGSWYWDDPCNMAPTCVYFRPRDYWPSGTTVSFTGHLDGVQGAPGVYGAHTLTQTFDIGRVADRGREHQDPPHADLLQRQAPLRLADQLRTARATTRPTEAT